MVACAGGDLAGLEQLDGIAGGVIEEDLGTAGACDDFVAEFQAGCAEAIRLSEAGA